MEHDPMLGVASGLAELHTQSQREAVTLHDAMLQDVVVNHDRATAGIVQTYERALRRMPCSGAPELFDTVSDEVAATLDRTEVAVSRVLDHNARALEGTLMPADAEILRRLQAIAGDPHTGIDSTAYQRVLGEASTSTARAVIVRVMDRRVLAQVNEDAQSLYAGLGSHRIREHIGCASSVRARSLIAEYVGCQPEDLPASGHYDHILDDSGGRHYSGRRRPGRVAGIFAAAASVTLVVGIAARGTIFADGTHTRLSHKPAAGASARPGRTVVPASNTIGQCYPTAPALYRPTTTPHPLTMPFEGSSVRGVPVYPKESLVKRVSQALVEITAAKENGTVLWKGSGFVTVDAEGKQVVVSGAHVLGVMKAAQLTITTADGRHVKPTGGCYIWANNGKLHKLTNDPRSPVDSDIAVLTLPGSLTLTNNPLTIATAEPRAGQVVNFIGYQWHNGPRNSLASIDTIHAPANYTGIVAPPSKGDPDVNIITGVNNVAGPGSKLTYNEYYKTHMGPGESGGAVVYDSGEVLGVSDFSVTEKGLPYVDEWHLLRWFGVSFPGADIGMRSGILPVDAGVMPIELIRYALSAPVLAGAAKAKRG